MDAWERYNQNLLVVHGGSATSGNEKLDVRHAELMAMADAFLGKDYDPTKLRIIEVLQAQAQRTQASLYERFQRQEISAEEYVATANKLTVDTFKQVEAVLGETDFVKLFGVRCEQVPGLIDLAAFESSHVADTQRQETDVVVVTPDHLVKASSKANTITGKHLAAKIATAHHLSKTDSEAIMRDVIALLVKNLRSGAKVRLAGLGVLEVRKRTATLKRNAATGEITQHKSRGKTAVHTVKNKGRQSQ